MSLSDLRRRPVGPTIVFVLLLLPALAGAGFSMLGILIAIMGSDSPRASGTWSSLIMLAAALIAAGTLALVAIGARMMGRGRVQAACVCLVPPALEAAAYLGWLRS